MTYNGPSGDGVQDPEGGRRDLLAVMRELADPDLQRRNWIHHEDYPNSSGIDEVVHFLFDDTDLSSDPRGELGAILTSEREVGLITQLCEILDDMISRLGNLPSEDYMNDTRWIDVQRVAREFLAQTAR